MKRFLTLLFLVLLCTSVLSQAEGSLTSDFYLDIADDVADTTYPTQIENTTIDFDLTIGENHECKDREERKVFCNPSRSRAQLDPWESILPTRVNTYFEGEFDEEDNPSVSYSFQFKVVQVYNTTPIFIQVGFWESYTDSIYFGDGTRHSGIVGGYDTQAAYPLYNNTITTNQTYVSEDNTIKPYYFMQTKINSTHNARIPAYDLLAYSKSDPTINTSLTHRFGLQGMNYNQSQTWNSTLRVQGTVTVEHDPVFYDYMQQPDEYPTTIEDQVKTTEEESTTTDTLVVNHLITTVAVVTIIGCRKLR